MAARLRNARNESEVDLQGFAVVLALIATARKRRERQRKATLPYVLRRQVFGAFHSLVQELATEDPKQLRHFLRLSGDAFDDLLHIVGPSISKLNTQYKDSIPPEERLAVTLRYLAQGRLNFKSCGVLIYIITHHLVNNVFEINYFNCFQSIANRLAQNVSIESKYIL